MNRSSFQVKSALMSSTQSVEISFIDRYQSHIFSEHLPKHKYNPHTDCPHPLRVGAFELQTHIDSSQLRLFSASSPLRLPQCSWGNCIPLVATFPVCTCQSKSLKCHIVHSPAFTLTPPPLATLHMILIYLHRNLNVEPERLTHVRRSDIL